MSSPQMGGKTPDREHCSRLFLNSFSFSLVSTCSGLRVRPPFFPSFSKGPTHGIQFRQKTCPYDPVAPCTTTRACVRLHPSHPRLFSLLVYWGTPLFVPPLFETLPDGPASRCLSSRFLPVRAHPQPVVKRFPSPRLSPVSEQTGIPNCPFFLLSYFPPLLLACSLRVVIHVTDHPPTSGSALEKGEPF